MKKATREQLKRHNRQLVLRAVYSGAADNRAALAVETGLAKPTVSDLIAEMITDGLLIENGRGESTDSGGKRPTLLKFVPDSHQVIGVSVEGGRIFGVLANLAGQISAEHVLDFTSEEHVLLALQDLMNGLIAQCDTPLLCIGIALEEESTAFEQTLTEAYNVPVYTGQSGELTALAQFAFGLVANGNTDRLVTVHIDDRVTVGVVLERGAYHHGADLSAMHIPTIGRIDSTVGWRAVERRIRDLNRSYPTTSLFAHDLTYMHLRYGAANGDAVALRVTDELSSALAQVFAWVIGLLRPDHVSLTGTMAVMGERFLNTTIQKTDELLSVEGVKFSLAYAENLSAVGAAALALQQELGTL
jgi:predicted NBD/HSP70 family sugar kinase